MQMMATAWQRCALVALATAATADGLMTMPSHRQVATMEHAHAIAMPEQKLAFCFVQKVASEHFGPLFNDVNNNSVTGDGKAGLSSVPNLGLDWSEMTRENGWRFAMFVRHPLERYLSAFLSKCVPVSPYAPLSNNGTLCFGPTLSGDVAPEAKVALFEERVRHDLAEGLADNDHWLSQHAVMRRHCGDDRFVPEDLDFLGHLTYDAEDVNRQVREMLELTSLPDAAALAGVHFPAAKATKLLQCADTHCTQEHEDFLKFYRTPEIVKGVVQLFQDDFDHYPFPRLDVDFNFTVPGLPATTK